MVGADAGFAQYYRAYPPYPAAGPYDDDPRGTYGRSFDEDDFRPSATATRWLDAVMTGAEKRGLLTGRSSRIGGRISPALIKQAKKQTGIDSDTDLIEFALANVALEDSFADVFKRSRGKIDPNLKLGF